MPSQMLLPADLDLFSVHSLPELRKPGIEGQVKAFSFPPELRGLQVCCVRSPPSDQSPYRGPVSRPVVSDSGTPWTAAARPLSVLHHLPKFAQVHVYCIGNAIRLSHPLTPWVCLNRLVSWLRLSLSVAISELCRQYEQSRTLCSVTCCRIHILCLFLKVHGHTLGPHKGRQANEQTLL